MKENKRQKKISEVPEAVRKL